MKETGSGSALWKSRCQVLAGNCSRTLGSRLPNHMPKHTGQTDAVTMSCMQQAQAARAGDTCRGRDPAAGIPWEDSEAGTLTPADGIQVPQSPAAAYGPGQRPVPPGAWTGSMWRGRAEVRQKHGVPNTCPRFGVHCLGLVQTHLS